MSENVSQRDRANNNAVQQLSTAGAGHMTDAIWLQGYSRVNFAISGVGAQSAALTTDTLSGAATYDIWADVDCFLKINTTANNVTAADGYLLRANNTVTFHVPSASKIGAITSGAAGTLSYHRVS